MDILKGIRPLDYVLAAVMVAAAVFIGFANVNAGADADVAHALDSHSALMIPVFGLAALPILWRRRSILGAIGVSFVVTAASVPMFGWVTRCGWALPLAIAMAYAVARFAGSRQNHVIGLVGVVALVVWCAEVVLGLLILARWLTRPGKHAADTTGDSWGQGPGLSILGHIGMFLGIGFFTWVVLADKISG